MRYGDRELVVEEATPEALAAGGLDLCFFSVGTVGEPRARPARRSTRRRHLRSTSRTRLPARADGVPLVVRGGERRPRAEHDGIVANPNCSTIQLTCALKPLHGTPPGSRARAGRHLPVRSPGAGGAGDRSGCGTEQPEEHDLRDGLGASSGDWKFERGGEAARRRPRKVLELPALRLQAVSKPLAVHWTAAGSGAAPVVDSQQIDWNADAKMLIILERTNEVKVGSSNPRLGLLMSMSFS